MGYERRIVTVLFADLIGFTALSENLDPEDMAAIQDRYFAAIRESVFRSVVPIAALADEVTTAGISSASTHAAMRIPRTHPPLADGRSPAQGSLADCQRRYKSGAA